MSNQDLLRCFMVKEPFELRSLSLKTELYFQRNNRVEKGFQEEERA